MATTYSPYSPYINLLNLQYIYIYIIYNILKKKRLEMTRNRSDSLSAPRVARISFSEVFFLGFLWFFLRSDLRAPRVARIRLREVFFFMVNACDIAYDFLILHRKNWCRIFCRFFSFQEIVTAVFSHPTPWACVYVYTYYTHTCVYVYTYIRRARFLVIKSPPSTLRLLCVCTHTQIFFVTKSQP